MTVPTYTMVQNSDSKLLYNIREVFGKILVRPIISH